MKRFPEGLLAMGDALASINPIYGQGMTLAALQALALRRELAHGARDLARRYLAAVCPIVDAAWAITVGGDLALDAVPGRRGWRMRAMNAYLARLRRAAVRSAHLSLALRRVVHLLDRPASLLEPGVLWRVLAFGAAPRALPRSQPAAVGPNVDKRANGVAGAAPGLP